MEPVGQADSPVDEMQSPSPNAAGGAGAHTSDALQVDLGSVPGEHAAAAVAKAGAAPVGAPPEAAQLAPPVTGFPSKATPGDWQADGEDGICTHAPSSSVSVASQFVPQPVPRSVMLVEHVSLVTAPHWHSEHDAAGSLSPPFP
jgi:hypothetical protein